MYTVKHYYHGVSEHKTLNDVIQHNWYDVSRLKYGFLRNHWRGMFDYSFRLGDPLVVYDDLHLPVPIETIQRAYDKARDSRLNPNFHRNKNYEFRSGPVPGIGGRRWGHWYRRVRTTNERRQNQNIDFEELDGFSVKTRKNLRTSYDDINRSDQYDRNWKTSRKTQWKE